MMQRVAFLHTGAVVIPTFAELAARLLPGIEVQHLLDDRIVADLGSRSGSGSGSGDDRIATRLADLGHAAVVAGATAVLLTCSSVSAFARPLAAELGIPVYRVDEAMADQAVAVGGHLGVLATLETTLRPTVDLLRERAELAGRRLELSAVVVPGAFDAVAAGDRARHDRLVVEQIERLGPRCDVLVLAQASMASAAGKAAVDVAVLTSPELGVRRLAAVLADDAPGQADP